MQVDIDNYQPSVSTACLDRLIKKSKLSITTDREHYPKKK